MEAVAAHPMLVLALLGVLAAVVAALVAALVRAVQAHPGKGMPVAVEPDLTIAAVACELEAAAAEQGLLVEMLQHLELAPQETEETVLLG